jgi:ribosome recycling factor
MLNDITNIAKNEMEKALEACKKQLASIRTGRASTSLLDGIKVEYYGNLSPLSQVASINVLDTRTLAIKPWEKGLGKAIEKAILDANIGFNPQVDGDQVRVPVPQLTEERRKEFVKQAKKRSEDTKVSVRNARRDANEMLKDAVKDGSITEDDEKRGLKLIQDLTDEYINKLDQICHKKEEEIMTV